MVRNQIKKVETPSAIALDLWCRGSSSVTSILTHAELAWGTVKILCFCGALEHSCC